MPPLVRTALIVGLLSILSRGAELSAGPVSARLVTSGRSEQLPQSSKTGGCPAGTLPDARVCVPVPAEVRPADVGGLDWIPRRPDRPERFADYQLPVPIEPSTPVRAADPAEGRGPGSTAPIQALQSTAFEMEVPSATPVTMPRFEEQQEAAEVVYVGTLVGLSLVTWHRTEVSGQPRDYLLVLGHLMQVSKDLRAGARVQAGRVIGAVGQSGTTRPGLHLEVRQVRRGIDVKQLQAVKLLDPSKTVATDPRNALALRQ